MSGDDVWHDRDVRFDVSPACMNLIAGEKVLQIFNSVEDSKGNSGEKGSLSVTNLRLLWHSIRLPKVNITIGLGCIVSTQPKVIQSKIQGMRESLLILTRASKGRFEFIFTNLLANDSSLFLCVSSVVRGYESSKMYRELRLRGSVINEDKLKTLANEEIFREVHGTYNLSNDQGNMGVMIITNIRAVWYAISNTIYNVSIPYLQIKNFKLKDSKFGLAMVFEVTEQGGGYTLGFRIDPVEKLKEVFKETKKLIKAYLHSPIFGIESHICTDTEHQTIGTADVMGFSDDINQTEHHSDSFATYCIDSVKANSRDAEYNEKLGLMMEKLPSGYTLEDLWDVLK